jgi:S1-C subfamily serine protease
VKLGVLALVVGGVAVWGIVNAVRKRGGAPVTMTPSESALSGEEAYQRLIKCTVLIVSPHGVGSGFVVDPDKRLVVTNFHVVGTERRVSVVFPQFDSKDELVTDAKRYDLRKEAAQFNGEVLKVDKRRDLAVVRVANLPARAAAVPLAKQPAATGSVVYSVGGSGAEDNLLWRLTKGTVRGRVHRTQEADFGTLDCMVLETDSPVNPGDSGGPVINDRGELVAVVSHGHRLARLVSGNIDVDEVRKLLE